MASFIPSRDKRQKLTTKLDAAQIQCIDSLRALAVLMVVIQHYKVTFAGARGILALLTTPGASGVMLFFVISGLCITLSKTENISWKQFYIRRAFRLLPALYVSMVVLIFANHFILHNRINASDFVGVALVLPHYFTSLIGFNPPLWSLQTEMELYLLFPIMLFLFFKTSRRTFITISVAITLVSYGIWFVSLRQFTYFPPFPALCYVIIWNLGLLLAYDVFPPSTADHRRLSLLAPACIILGVGFVCLLLRNKAMTNSLAFWYILNGCGYYLLTKWALSERPFLLRAKVMEMIGKRSYSLYLVHLPIATLCSSVIHAKLLACITALFVMGVFVEILYQYVEMPCVRFGKRLTASTHKRDMSENLSNSVPIDGGRSYAKLNMKAKP